MLRHPSRAYEGSRTEFRLLTFRQDHPDVRADYTAAAHLWHTIICRAGPFLRQHDTRPVQGGHDAPSERTASPQIRHAPGQWRRREQTPSARGVTQPDPQEAQGEHSHPPLCARNPWPQWPALIRRQRRCREGMWWRIRSAARGCQGLVSACQHAHIEWHWFPPATAVRSCRREGSRIRRGQLYLMSPRAGRSYET